MKQLAKTYNPKENESKIYRQWEKSGFFNPDKLPARHKEPYSVIIAPPNITGELHIGHALENTLLDILIRQKRMAGYKVLWLPGTDHAGIAAQNVVEKELKKEGLTRHDLGREKLIKRIMQWREKYGHLILDQLKKMGFSCDWSRTAYTMNKDYQEAVKKVFLHYYEKGWIYQGKRVINWCPRCQTSLSDLELEYKEKKSHLWHIKYLLVGTRTKFITVATTRPETMLGDTAVAVHPKDKRYKKLIGKSVLLPLTEREIPIIGKESIDPEFGTGALKVTPAHSLIDAEIGERHNLPAIQVISDKGTMTKQAGREFASLAISDARKKVVQELKKQGLLEKIEDYTHQVPVCYRCNSIIENIPSQQWFLKMDQLAQMAIKAVKSGQTKILPKRWEKVYFDWLDNIRDWCVSRQIWWGPKIPIDGIDDTLDTWFSSALWPFATLGWPKKTKDLKEFYPTDLITSARDILHFWITRMIFSGLEFTEKTPFKTAYIHATVLTKEGQRMSKSLGTGIDPLELVKKYGADATRFGLAYQSLDNQDIKFTEDNILAGKKFANKIWNASRFVISQTKKSHSEGAKRPKNLKMLNKRSFASLKMTMADKAILKQLETTKKEIDKDLESFKFGYALHTLYDFFWHNFCDVYLEKSKKQETSETKQVLVYVLVESLKMIHPFMPFVSEAIYQELPFKKEKFLMIENW